MSVCWRSPFFRYIRNAHFSDTSAIMEGIEYIEDRQLDKGKMLRLATCRYVHEGRHIILKGAFENEKTYIACAFGNAVCRKFETVRPYPDAGTSG